MPDMSSYDQAKTSVFSCKKEINAYRMGGDKVVPIFSRLCLLGEKVISRIVGLTVTIVKIQVSFVWAGLYDLVMYRKGFLGHKQVLLLDRSVVT
ncbi:hypothetical protein ACFX2G_047875 [Malus domestica]